MSSESWRTEPPAPFELRHSRTNAFKVRLAALAAQDPLCLAAMIAPLSFDYACYLLAHEGRRASDEVTDKRLLIELSGLRNSKPDLFITFVSPVPPPPKLTAPTIRRPRGRRGKAARAAKASQTRRRV